STCDVLRMILVFDFSTAPAPTARYTLSLHDALPIFLNLAVAPPVRRQGIGRQLLGDILARHPGSFFLEVRESNHAALGFYEHLRSEEHTSELQSRGHLVCRLLLEKKKKNAAQNSNLT